MRRIFNESRSGLNGETPSQTTVCLAQPRLIDCATVAIESSSKARASVSPDQCPKAAKTSLQNQAKNRILETIRNCVSGLLWVASLSRSSPARLRRSVTRRIETYLQQGQSSDLAVSMALGKAPASEQRRTLGPTKVLPYSRHPALGLGYGDWQKAQHRKA